MGWLHRLTHYFDQIVAQGIQFGHVAQRGGENLECPSCVVLHSVEVPAIELCTRLLKGLNSAAKTRVETTTASCGCCPRAPPLSELEEDTDEAWQKRRELVTQLVERITVSRAEDGRPKAHIAYRFAPPVQVASSVMNVLLFDTLYDTSPLTLVATVVK